MPQYLYRFLPGSRPQLATDPGAWSEADGEIGARHYERLRAAAAGGKVILAGRCTDGIGPAIVIFEADSEASARDFMEQDPFVAEGLFHAELHPYSASITRDGL